MAGRRRAGVFSLLVSGGVIAASLAAPAASAGTGNGPSGSARTDYVAVTAAPKAPHGTRELGALPATRAINGAVTLKPRDPAALTALAKAVADRQSPLFHHYLSVDEFRARFGPTASTIAGVEQALRARGLTATGVSRNGLFVHYRGTVAQSEAAFRTTIERYRLPTGRRVTMTTSAPKLPASVASQVESITGLDSGPKAEPAPVTPTHTHPRAGKLPSIPHYAGAANPCSSAVRTAKSENGLTEDQIEHAYGVDGLYKQGDLGQNLTVALYELAPFDRSDVQTFDSCYFGKTAASQMMSRLHTINVDGGPGTGFDGDGSVEAVLDIDDVSAFAPQANINVYSGAMTQAGELDTFNAIVSDDTAQVASVSYGFGCEAQAEQTPGFVNAENDLFEQAAVQGQSIFVASGDWTSDDCSVFSGQPTAPEPSVSDPAGNPWVIAVGGTSINDVNGKPNETVWDQGGGVASGGGVSQLWGSPSWQAQQIGSAADQASLAQGYSDGAVACPGASSGGSCRQLPDVAAEGDPNTGAPGIYLGAFGGWGDIGGTSSSSPMWAAMVGLMDKSPACENSGPLGFVAPSLYQVADNSTEDAASFNDITAGNNDGWGIFGGKDYQALKGFDMTTGLGSPIVTSPHGPALDTYLCAAVAASNRPTVTSLTPSAVPVGAQTPVVVSGSNFTGVTSVSVGSVGLAHSDWTLVGPSTIDITAPTAAQQSGGAPGPDGAGPAVVSVTTSSGVTSAATVASTLQYVEGSSATPVPSVTAVSATGGPEAGGNSVTIYGGGFADSGPDAITHVTFGGVDASAIHVITPYKLTATVPAYSSGTTDCETATDPGDDVCQTEVVVSNANGSSATSPITAPKTGDLSDCVNTGTPCSAPANTEYDYAPTPTISSIDANYISEYGDSLVTITGSGFDPLTLQYVNFGPSTKATSWDNDFLSITPTQIQILANGYSEQTVEPVTTPVTAFTYGGLSNSVTTHYAGVPNLNSISTVAGPTTGGTSTTLAGSGFDGTAPADGGAIVFSYFGFINEPQLGGYTVNSDKRISLVTAPETLGEYSVEACTVTGCSFPTTERQFEDTIFTFFQPGDPVVSSLSVKKGPASGGTKLVITGHNLSNVVAVSFGSSKATAFNNTPDFFSGNAYAMRVTVPPGKAGSTVNVRVTTVESLYGGHSSAVTTADRFTYRPSAPSAPQDVKVKVSATNAKVSWKRPQVDGGAPITAYQVIARPERQSPSNHRRPKETIVTVKPGARSATLHGLKGGWFYDFVVKAKNKHGFGPGGTNENDYLIHEKA